MKSVNLDERLKCAADFVRQGSVVADIGTDHGYLLAHLIQCGTITSGIGCDINQGPLDSAAKTMREHGCYDSVSLRLSDGLQKVQSGECDDIVIAGMGGELIISIIDAAKWVKDEHLRLILQPMSKGELLRKYLLQNGFNIIAEKAAFAAGRYYTVICAEYSGVVRECDEFFAFVGKLCDCHDENSAGYKNLIIRRLQKQANGMKIHDPDSADKLFSLINRIRDNV